jgi:cell wall-associated NlpC family hydrolase
MFLAIILIIIGAMFLYGSIGNYSILQLFVGKQVKNSGGGSTTGNGTSTAVLQNPTFATGFQLLNIAKQYLGVPYKWGGNDPSIGIDCSRFVQLVYGQLGINLPRTSQAQYNLGTVVPYDPTQGSSGLQIGDVIFTEPSPTGPGHEGIYVGNNQVQESPHTGARNEIIPLSKYLDDGLVGVKRYL